MRGLGYVLVIVGSFLVFTWFGTRRMMLRDGTWSEQGGAGAYIWLAIYVGLIAVGVMLTT
jgi:hypothetical protein